MSDATPPKPAAKPCKCGVPIEPTFVEPMFYEFAGRRKQFSGTNEWKASTMCEKCAEEAREKAEREAIERDIRTKAQHLDSLFARCGFAPRENDMAMKKWIGPESAKAPFVAWADGERSLFVHGAPGNGKTHAAVVSLSTFIQKYRQQGKFWVVADLVRNLRMAVKTHNDDAMVAELISVPALVLDDIAIERPTGFVLEAIQSIVDTRFRHKMKMIITSNLSLEELAEKLDDRIASRLADISQCDVIKFTGRDRRLTGGE